MLVCIAKHDDKGVLRCIRADGSESWQRQSSRHALHFVHHDLTHFAVETILEMREAFFGLIASGWDIEDTTGTGKRGALPDDAIVAEHLVGLLDVQRATLARWDASYMIEQLLAANVPLNPARRAQITDAALDQIRARRAELSMQWENIPRGGSIELEFPER